MTPRSMRVWRSVTKVARAQVMLTQAGEAGGLAAAWAGLASFEPLFLEQQRDHSSSTHGSSGDCSITDAGGRQVLS